MRTREHDAPFYEIIISDQSLMFIRKIYNYNTFINGLHFSRENHIIVSTKSHWYTDDKYSYISNIF